MKKNLLKVLFMFLPISIITACGGNDSLVTGDSDVEELESNNTSYELEHNGHNHCYVVIGDDEVDNIQPTCTTPGKSKVVCYGCGQVKYDVIDPLGHDYQQIHLDKYLCSPGTPYEKASYYYSCSRCGEVDTSRTFKYGVRDYIYTNRCTDSNSSKAAAKKNYYKRCYNKANELVEKTDVDLSSKYHISTGYKFTYSEAHTVINNMIADNPQFFFLNLNSSVQYTTQGDKIVKMSLGLYSALKSASGRKIHREALERTNKEVDALIRDDATEVEKALIIYAYIAHHVSYDVSITSLGSGPASGKGNCQTYSKWFKYLADRHNLGSLSVYSSTHAYDAVYIDGIWYGIDVCWGDDKTPTLGWFCCNKSKILNTEHHGVTGAPLNETAISSKLMKLFKNDELVGVYYNLDDALAKVNDVKGDYRIEFGVKKIAGYSLSPQLSQQYNSTIDICSFNSLHLKTCNGSNVKVKLSDRIKNKKSISYEHVEAI